MNPSIKKNASFFHLCQRFSFQKSFFLWKNSKNGIYFTQISEFFERLFEEFEIFKFYGASLQIHRNFRRMLFVKFIKPLIKIGLDPAGTLGKGMKMLENLGENRLYFVKEFKKMNILWIFPSYNEKKEICLQSFTHFDQKMKAILKF